MKKVLILSFVILSAAVAKAADKSTEHRKPASSTWSCCRGASGVCATGAEVSCERATGQTVCRSEDGQQGPAVVSRTSAGRQVAFVNSAQVYSACASPNND